MELASFEKEKYVKIREVIEEYRGSLGSLIQVLHKTQNILGYLPQEIQRFIAHQLNIPYSRIYGVITFYDFFRLDPVGKYTITVCLGTACYVKGGLEILKTLKKELKVEVGRTTRDRLFTLSTARCFGSCGLAPVIMINKEIYGRLSPRRVLKVVEEYRLREANRGGE